jgi:hypothetical protein
MKRITVAFIAILLFAACRNGGSKESTSIVALNKTMEDNKRNTTEQIDKLSNNIGNTENAPQQEEKAKQTKPQIPVTKEDWDKKIIKTASLNLEIKDFKNYNSIFREKVKQVGGYIAQEQQSETEYKIENTLTIKVPVDQFDNAVQLLINDVKKLNEKRITSEDVTTEFVDTRSRLESKKQVRLRYLDLLKQARNMEEILSVQSEINGIQEEIESASGRIEYMSHSSSFSTINLTFYQIVNASAVDQGKITFSTKLGNAFKNGWSWIGEVFVGIVSIWPLLLMIFAGFIIYKKTKTPKVKQA